MLIMGRCWNRIAFKGIVINLNNIHICLRIFNVTHLYIPVTFSLHSGGAEFRYLPQSGKAVGYNTSFTKLGKESTNENKSP